jgi:putative zinc finger protein
MTKRFPPHPAEELLEEYVLHRLPEQRAAEVEEHLLVCESCREAIRELDLFVATMKVAVAPPATRPLRYLSTSSRMGAASALALVLLALVVFRTYPIANPAPAGVTLSSLRGYKSLSEAPAGKPLLLSIEAPDLTAGQDYRIVVVDASGGQDWAGTATYGGGKLLVQVQTRLASGVYWVRVFDAQGLQLREFGMSVK